MVPRASQLKGIFGARFTSSRSSPIGLYSGGFYTVGGSLLEITLELGFPFVITFKSLGANQDFWCLSPYIVL